MLAEATQHNELRQRFLDEVRETETAEELQGRRVEMVKMELEDESSKDGMTRTQIINDLVNCALQYDEDVIKNQILVLGDLNHQYSNEFEEQELRLKGTLKKLVNKHSTVINGNVSGDVISDGGTKHETNYDKDK